MESYKLQGKKTRQRDSNITSTGARWDINTGQEEMDIVTENM